MPVAALIQFTQGGGPLDSAGRAAFGVDSLPVTVSNGATSTGTIVNRQFSVIDAAYKRSLVPGIVQDGLTPTWTFNPDVVDGYLIVLTVTGADGTTATDIRTFGVKRSPSGRFIPPFSATAPTLNFGGQERGWADFMEPWLTYLDSLDQPVRINGNTTLTSPLQRDIYTDTTGGTLTTITLPSTTNAVDGQLVVVYDETGQWATHNLVVTANATQNLVKPGGTVGGSVTLSQAYGSMTWRYSAPAKLWLLEDTTVSSGGGG